VGIGGPPATAPDVASDGRVERRTRNRTAVVDALLALVADGDLDPSSDRVAARAGLSTRSLFRYFDDVDDLCRAAIAAQHERVATLFDRPIVPGAPRAARVRDAVTHRVELFDAMGDVGRLARLRAPFQPLVAAELRAARGWLRTRLATLLAPELAALGRRGDAALDAADVLCSFEAYRLLRDELGRDREAAVDVLVTGVLGVVAPEVGAP
jgi:AcrR family transcriptional regulator